MNNYETLINEIKEFVNKKEIDNDLWFCSLYSLYTTINNGFKGYRDITKNSKIQQLLKEIPMLAKTKINFDNDDKTVYVRLLDSKNVVRATICKDKNVNKIYFKNKSNDIYYNFIDKNQNLFFETLIIYEEYISIIKNIKSEKTYLTDCLLEPLFRSVLSYNSFGDVDITLEINQDYIEDYIYDKNEKNFICDFVNQNKEKIFKRFEVPLLFLESPFDDLYKTFSLYSCNYNSIKNKIEEFMHKKEINIKNSNVEVINLYEFINIITNELEEYISILAEFKFNSTFFQHDLFKVELTIGPNGEVDTKTNFKMGEMLFNQRKEVFELVKKQKNEIYKRIPVTPYKLDEPFKTLYNRYKEKQNEKIKVKKL